MISSASARGSASARTQNLEGEEHSRRRLDPGVRVIRPAPAVPAVSVLVPEIPDSACAIRERVLQRPCTCPRVVQRDGRECRDARALRASIVAAKPPSCRCARVSQARASESSSASAATAVGSTSDGPPRVSPNPPSSDVKTRGGSRTGPCDRSHRDHYRHDRPTTFGPSPLHERLVGVAQRGARGASETGDRRARTRERARTSRRHDPSRSRR